MIHPTRPRAISTILAAIFPRRKWLAMLGLLTLLASPVHAATIVVNSLEDNSPSNSGDHQCTLREAITNANAAAETTKGDCVAGTGNDTITFIMSGVITLSTDLPPISNTLTIDASGQLVAVSGQFESRIFDVAEGATLNLNLLQIGDGLVESDPSCGGVNCGGSILNNGTLTITNCEILGQAPNEGQGGDKAAIRKTPPKSFAQNGGGLYNNGTATISSSLFAFNSVTTGEEEEGDSDGGAIYNSSSGTLQVSNSTFYSNSAENYGGAIYNGNLSEKVTVTLINDSFSVNSALEGGDEDFGGGGLASSGVTNVSNSYFDESTGNNCVNFRDAPTIHDLGHNLSDDSSCNFNAAGSQNSLPSIGLDPGGLGFNGGPTLTIALCTAANSPDGCDGVSPAVGTGDSAICAAEPINHKDQRGFTRPSSCDIGAYDSRATHNGSESGGGDKDPGCGSFDFTCRRGAIGEFDPLTVLMLGIPVLWNSVRRRKQ